MSDWSELPYELIVLIANRLVELEDFISFSAVCHSWRLVYLNKDWTQNQRTPWLMMGEFSDHDFSRRKFFNVTALKTYTISLPDAHACQCWGTSHGLIAVFDQSFAMRLLNPITQMSIDLPPLSMLGSGSSARTYWFNAIQKTFVLKLRHGLVTILTYRYQHSAYSRTGDTKWTILPFPIPVSLDVVCFKNQIFAITVDGTLMVLEINGGESPRTLFVASPPKDEKQWKWSNAYLVESLGNLLLVFGYELGVWRQHMLRFKVYKFDVSRRKWDSVDDLGDRFLLVDEMRCVSGSSYGCFKSNCVYYANDSLESFAGFQNRSRGQQHVTVYNVKDESREVFWVTDNYPYCYTCPMWIIPSLW